MTDKQIIIDDQKQTIRRLQDECKEKTNAIIALGEQLKTKEQECERYKQLAGKHCVETINMQRELDQLKQTNEELQKDNEGLRKEVEAIYDDCKGCPTCNEALYNANLYAKEYRKLEQTLTKIKEIAESNVKPNLVKRMNGTARYGISKIIELAEVENAR